MFWKDFVGVAGFVSLPGMAKKKGRARCFPPRSGLMLLVLTALRHRLNPKSDVQSLLCRNSKHFWTISTPKVVARGRAAAFNFSLISLSSCAF